MRDDERFTPADQLPDGLYERAKALAQKALTVEGCTVPWLAGRSLDGSEFYPDTALPLEVDAGDGVLITTRTTVIIHELAELLCMDDGETYDKDSDPPGQAHYHANGCEKIALEEQGGQWDPYCLALRPAIKQTDDPTLSNLPPLEKWDRRPYEDDDPTLEAEIVAADAEKSTFAPPAAATSGLQSYDLEGASARRKKRRKGKTTATGEPVTKESNMDELKLFIPLTKIDFEKRLVYGIATAELPDVAGEVCDYASTKPLYQKWSESFVKVTDGKSLGNLRVMHGPVAAGKLTDLAFDDDGKKIEICAKVVDDGEWAKVNEGVYTGFSQGGKYVRRWKDGDFTRYTAEPIEISLVDAPCLPEATFSIVKADGTTELRKFKDKAPDPARPNAGTPNDNPIGKQVWVNERLPGKQFDKKADLEKALLELDAAEAAQKQAKPVLDALAGVAEKLGKGAEPSEAVVAKPSESLAKKDYSADERNGMASNGEAKNDGSYPIKTPKDVADAVKDFNRTKGSASDKRHIIKRAKALGKAGTDELPADWPGSTQKADDADSKKNAAQGDLAKGASFYSISNLLLLLDMVQQAEDAAEGNTWGFGPSVELPKDVTDRFGAALVEFGDIIAEMLDAVLASVEDEEASEAVAAAARIIDLQKIGNAWALAKVGAKHSKADKGKIKAAHDLLADLDPDCCPGGDGGEDDDADKMIKVLQGERDADREAFASTLEAIMVAVKKIADQPLPMGTSSVTVRLVDKTVDGGGTDFGKVADRLDGSVGADDGLERLADAAQRAARRIAR